MQTITSIRLLRNALSPLRNAGRSIGLVPTMGYLHEGHARLVSTAREQNDVVVVSIFVNPLQFGPNEDFAQYPRDLHHDEQMLTALGCDFIFAPSVNEMYPEPAVTVVDLPEMGQVLCGRTRPIHFRGVATVVSKLLHIVQPDKAYFGQKDGQQLAIILRMVQDLNLPLAIVGVPTVRESDGLAKSSRNIFLSVQDRPHATVLYRALQVARDDIEAGQRFAAEVMAHMAALISAEPTVRLDYAEAVDARTLQPLSVLSGTVMLAVAAYVGKTRLIDNIVLPLPPIDSPDIP
ncbi:pantoate--beta-alanine ligase [Alicyclobacillaceae bacterium I2511]|nr:pantoate--beta-alanine ligase [Alicyclobacillaceae bacterium I2511]